MQAQETSHHIGRWHRAAFTPTLTAGYSSSTLASEVRNGPAIHVACIRCSRAVSKLQQGCRIAECDHRVDIESDCQARSMYPDKSVAQDYTLRFPDRSGTTLLPELLPFAG